MMRALGHDFVMRRNIRIGFTARGSDPTTFLKWTYGSHHTRLVSCITSTWNDLLGRKTTWKLNLSPRPILRVVNSGEKFGLVASNDATSFGGLIDIKKEEPHDDLQDLVLHDSDGDHAVEHILSDLNIDPTLLHAPAITPVSHLHSTARRDLASKFIGPTHTLHVENSETGTSKSLETSLEVIVSCTTCMSVCACHAYMPQIQDLTNDGPHQSVLKRKVKCGGGSGGGGGDDDNDDPIDLKRARLATEMQEMTGPSLSAAAATSPPSGRPLPTNDLRLFFAKSRGASQTSAQPRASTSTSSSSLSDASLASLSQPLPLPVPTGTRFTRSQLLFSVLTGINAHALSIKTGDEFFLFMNMREELAWVSYNMTSRRWALATDNYNSRLQAINSAKNIETVPKHPRALMEHLGVVETKIAARIARKDFTCMSSFYFIDHEITPPPAKKSGTDTFWKRHCFAVSLVKEASSGEEQKSVGNFHFLQISKQQNLTQVFQRKMAICSRCQTIMYPGGIGNHKRGYCTDGVRQIVKKGGDDALPDWPQPQGIFERGTHFYPIEFLKMLREVYEKLVVGHTSGLDVPIEYAAFTTMLGKRTTIDQDGTVLFRLFDLAIPSSTPDKLITLRDGRKHLRLDCLSG